MEPASRTDHGGLARAAAARSPRRSPPRMERSWSTPAGPTASMPPVAALSDSPERRRDRRRRRRPRPPRRAGRRRCSSLGRLDLLVNNASTLGASPLPSLDTIDLDVLRRDLRGERRRAARADAAALADARGERRHRRERHLRRGGRGLRDLGRVRLVEGRARAAVRRPRAPSSRSYGCWSSIPATCAPRCTRTRSRARTSPTGRSPRPSCPACSPSSTAIDRAVGTVLSEVDVMTAALEHPSARASRSTRRSKPTSRPKCVAAGVTTCGCSSPTAPTASCTRRSATCRPILRAGDLRRREHVGDHRRAAIDGRCRDGRDVRIHFSTELPGGLWLVEARSRSTAPPRRSTTTSPASTSRSTAAVTCTLLERFADSSGCGSRRRISRDRSSITSPSSASPSATAHAPGTVAAERVPADLRRRARQRRDAERVSPVHGRARRRPRAAWRRHRADPPAHRACRRSKATRCRTPSATACPTRPPRIVNAVHQPGGRVSPSAPPWCARSRPSPTIAASCTPAPAGPSSSSPPNAACTRSTACSPGGTSPRRRTCSCSKRSPGGPRSSRPTPKHARGGYLWHEFGDSHLLLPGSTVTSATSDSRRARRCPKAAARCSTRLRRRGQATADRHRAPARHDGERRAPAPRPRSSTKAWPRRPSCRGPRGSAAGPSSRTRSPTRPTASSRRPTASSPTSCSATSPTPTPDWSTRSSSGAGTSGSATRPNASRSAARLKAKVAELTRILDDDGYLATCEEITPGVYRIVEHNCAIWAVAQRYGQACTSEIDFIRTVLPGGERRAGAAHGRRRTPLRVRGAPVTLNP